MTTIGISYVSNRVALKELSWNEHDRDIVQNMASRFWQLESSSLTATQCWGEGIPAFGVQAGRCTCKFQKRS